MNEDKKTYFIALGIVVMVTLAVILGSLNFIFKWAFWVVLVFIAIYVLMRMWKNMNKKEDTEPSVERLRNTNKQEEEKIEDEK